MLDGMATSRRRASPIRYAVVGLGHFAQASVLPAFAGAGKTSQLAALVSGSPEKLTELGDRYGVTHRFSYEQFDDCLEHVDAVYICTPNSEHAVYAERAARAGRHVLCEKPLAVTEEECARILAARDDGGVKLMTAYRLHFEPITLEVLGHARSGKLGDLRYFSAAFSMHTKPGGIRTRRELGGGAVFDLGIYCINAARMLFDAEPERVSAFAVTGERSGMPEVDETTSAVLHFAGDRIATFTTSFDAADVSTYRIVGTEGQIVVDPAFEHAEPLAYTMTIGETTTKKKGKKVGQVAAELVYFSRCIHDDVAPEPSGEEGAWDVRIIEAIHESARRGTAIDLRPFSEPGPEGEQALALAPPSGKPELVEVASPHED